jgi:rhamnosyltransferase subunit B
VARVLIGWELGAGRGHIVSMLAMSRALKARGHDVAIAVQRFNALAREALPQGVRFLQAPLWPGLLNGDDRSDWKPAVTAIDILGRLGLAQPKTLTHLLLAWDGIFSTFDPHIVVADYAPALLLAANGRLPSINIGPGFEVPPTDVDPIPRLGGAEPGYDEAVMLDIIDADLRDAGREALPTLASVFRSTRGLIAGFPELDPFGRPDGPDFIAPAVGDWAPPSGARGNEIFVYANGPVQRLDAFWQGLSQTGLPIRVHLPVSDDTLRDRIAALGVTVERKPIPWPLIAARSRMAVNHGAHGIMSALMLAGIPQLALPLDLEKRLHSEAMAKAGFGLMRDPNILSASQLAADVEKLYADAELASGVRKAAPDFAARVSIPFEESLADAVEALL